MHILVTMLIYKKCFANLVFLSITYNDHNFFQLIQIKFERFCCTSDVQVITASFLMECL